MQKRKINTQEQNENELDNVESTFPLKKAKTQEDKERSSNGNHTEDDVNRYNHGISRMNGDRDQEEEEENSDLEYAVEDVVDVKKDLTGQLKYKVQWEGFPGQDTWEPEENIKHTDAFKSFFSKQKLKSNFKEQKREAVEGIREEPKLQQVTKEVNTQPISSDPKSTPRHSFSPSLTSEAKVTKNGDKTTSKHKKDKNGNENKPFSLDKCFFCNQYLEDANKNKYDGDTEDTLEEDIALTSEKLTSMVSDLTQGYDEKPQYKINHFAVYDDEGHLCAIDSGLIDKDIPLYASGVIKPIADDDVSDNSTGARAKIGPLNEWWFGGFDGGANVLIAISTSVAEYILMQPSEQYNIYYSALVDKLYLAKVVIEYLSNNHDDMLTYEDMVEHVQKMIPPHRHSSPFQEDSILRNALFICEQVENYDMTADEGDFLLMETECMQLLVQLAAFSLSRSKRVLEARNKHNSSVVKRLNQEHKKATTTPLVKKIFEDFFAAQIAGGNILKKRRRCGKCKACLVEDCAKCVHCLDMKKFGGPGIKKQACKERPPCENVADSTENEDDDSTLSASTSTSGLASIAPKAKKSQKQKIFQATSESKSEKSQTKLPFQRTHKNSIHNTVVKKISWHGSSIGKDKVEKRTYYEQATFDTINEPVHVNDVVSIDFNESADNPLKLGRVMYMWEDTESKEKYAHVKYFIRGAGTVLGEVADTNEVFLIDKCADIGLKLIIGKVNVVHRPTSNNWSMEGGLEEKEEVASENTYFFRKFYEVETARFMDPSILHLQVAVLKDGKYMCSNCEDHKLKESKKLMTVGDPTESHNSKTFYSSCLKDGITYKIGDGVYLKSDSYSLNYKPSNSKKLQTTMPEDDERFEDEEMYPEFYRKKGGGLVKGSDDGSQPFLIASVTSIYKRKDSQIMLNVRKFYRPEDTHLGFENSLECDRNLLVWSDEEADISFSNVVGKCDIKHISFIEDLDKYNLQDEAFYYEHAFDIQNESFVEVPSKYVHRNWSKKKDWKPPKSSAEEEKGKKLKTLDIFAGCGGLSEGLDQSGACESSWAIEFDPFAAQAYSLNFPDAIVFNQDCNDLLDLIIQGNQTDGKGKVLPKRGEVEAIVGGPPCQGYSGMNRFSSGEYSRFKNSLVVTYLSYCDYFRPRFFLLENVRNFLSFKNSTVLRLVLRCLLSMGYQCCFGVRQAGQFGVPQSRRRAFILAAAPGEILPELPEPTHVFPRSSGNHLVTIAGSVYKSGKRSNEAQFRATTVRDALSDLPPIQNGSSTQRLALGAPKSDYQRRLRKGVETINDHICKEMNSLVVARMENIPSNAGADWRDLPNVELELPDGSKIKKLVYTHDDIKQGRNSIGGYRGVCSCAEGKTCYPDDKQENTLIPWCLPHTGNRHNNWAGLYGRLDWNGYFSTTITNPEPMGKQGRVLHPEQPRVVSVRECARSQGFPDSFQFAGMVLNRHRQVGNAVPPPLACAIGKQLKRATMQKHLLQETALQLSHNE